MTYHSKKFNNFLSSVADDKKVLHVGCVGSMSGDVDKDYFTHKFLGKCASSVCGIDINPEGIEKMKSLGFDCEVADVLFYQTVEKYDVIAFLSVLQFIPDPVLVLKKAKQWLKDGGKVIIEVPNVFSFSNQMRNLFKFFSPKRSDINGQSKSGEVVLFNSSLLLNILIINGYRVETIKTFTITPWSKEKGIKENLRNLLNNIPRLFSKSLGPSLVVLAVKDN